MKDEPKLDDISEDDEQPATKGDVRRGIDELASLVADFSVATEKRFQSVESNIEVVKEDVSTLKEDTATLKRASEHILEVVNSIDAKTEGLPERVERLEKKVLGFAGK